VDTRSIKAASFGLWDVRGWVMKMSAYSIESTDVANTTAKVIPIIKISRAWISSGVWRFSGCWRTDGGIVYFLREHVCGAGIGGCADGWLTVCAVPVGWVLAGIPV
jgi:hypothetical protein